MRIDLTTTRPSMALPLHGIENVRVSNASQISKLICSPIHGFDSISRSQHV